MGGGEGNGSIETVQSNGSIENVQNICFSLLSPCQQGVITTTIKCYNILV